MGNENKEKIDSLYEQICYHNDLYFNKGKTEITDFEFDRLVRLYTAYTYKEVELIGTIDKRFAHERPMLGLSKVHSKENLIKFLNKYKKDEFCIQQKVDGCALSLIYRDGMLIRCLTRGDGKLGGDVTIPIVAICADVPLTIKYKGDLEVRGEVYMSKSDLLRWNLSAETNGKRKLANTRNACISVLISKDVEVMDGRKLSFLAYELFGADDSSEQSKLASLRKLGFNTLESHYSNDINEIIAIVCRLEREKNFEDFDVDGCVIKLCSTKLRNSLKPSPVTVKWATAYKYEEEVYSTTLREVERRVSEKKAITYILHFDTVVIGGANISKASICGDRTFRALDIKVGDRIRVIKSGSVIPKVLGRL